MHGLWPEVGNYGSSKCFTPASTAPPTADTLAACYNGDVDFASHEWSSHGQCADKTSAQDFFYQVCNLSQAPLKIMASMKTSGASITDMATSLGQQGYSIWSPDAGNDQLEIAVCAGTDGVWKFSDPANFSVTCGN